MDDAKTTDKIVFRLMSTNVFTRWHCNVCGGRTEKVPILCEHGDRTKDCLLICERCLRDRDFDAQLECQAQALEAEAARARALIGRIEAPSFADWEKAMADNDAERERWVRDLPRGDQVDVLKAERDLYGPDDLF